MVSDTLSLIVNGNAPFLGAFFCVFCKNERQCSVFQAVSKPFFTSKEGGLNRLDWVGMLRFRQFHNTDTCYFFLIKIADARKKSLKQIHDDNLYNRWYTTKKNNYKYDRKIRYK